MLIPESIAAGQKMGPTPGSRRIRKQSTRPFKSPNRRSGSCKAPAIAVVKWAYRRVAPKLAGAD
jgi:hypothetical protein